MQINRRHTPESSVGRQLHRWARVAALAMPTVAALAPLGSCGRPSATDGGGAVASTSSALVVQPTVNPKRGTDGRGARQDLTHVGASSAVGRIDATSEVKDGAFLYHVPLRVPSGVAGLQPALSLEYSSYAPNGPVGVGWSLAGLSVISRCGHTRSRDGFAAGFDFNRDHSVALNQYCLDGNKLVPTARSGNTVTYQTERADFSSIQAVYASPTAADPDYFKVLRKSGQVAYYGFAAATNSRASAIVAAADANPTTFTYAWYLDRLEDRDGNAIVYSYVADVGYPADAGWSIGPVTRYLSSITYAGRWIRFVYESRPDAIPTFAPGFDTTVSQRLKAIEIYTPASTAISWRYALAYGTSMFSARSELTSLQECDQFGACRPATTFNWQRFTPQSPTRPPLGDANDYRVASYPMGNSSQCTASTSFQCFDQLSFTNLLAGDLDGDGRDDLIYTLGTPAPIPRNQFLQDETRGRLIVRISSASGIGPEIDASSILARSTGGHDRPLVLDASRVVDLDNDGKAEVVLAGHFVGAGTTPTYRAFQWSASTRTLVPISASTNLATILQAAPWTWDDSKMQNAGPITFADFNGDGLADINVPVAAAGGSYVSRFYTNLGHFSFGMQTAYAGPQVVGYADFLVPATWPFAFASSFQDFDGDRRVEFAKLPNETAVYTDVNGDGLTDLIDFRLGSGTYTPPGLRFTGLVNAGRGWTAGGVPFPPGKPPTEPGTLCLTGCYGDPRVKSYVFPGVSSTGGSARTVRVGDFNGDGRQDLVLLQYPASPLLMLSTGDDYQPVILPVLGRSFGFSNPTGTTVADVDGDGLTDLVQFARGATDESIHLETITSNGGVQGISHRGDVIVEVRDGLKAAAATGSTGTEIVEYQPLGKGPYTATCAQNAGRCLRRGMLVVSRHWMDRAHTLGLEAVEYSYDSAHVDPAGRGFIGFEKISAQDKLWGTRNDITTTFTCATLITQESFGLTAFTQVWHGNPAPLTALAHPWTDYVAWNADPMGGASLGTVCYPSTVTRTNAESILLSAGAPSSAAPVQVETNVLTNELIKNMPASATPGTFVVRPKRLVYTKRYRAASTTTTLTGSPNVQRTTDYTYDAFNNQSWVAATVDGVTETYAPTYTNDTTNWFIGQPQSETRTRANASGTVTQTTAYTYATDGRVKTVTIEPNDTTGDLKRVDTFAYNPNGTLAGTAQLAPGGTGPGGAEIRHQRYVYDSSGVYRIEMYNEVEDRTTYTYDFSVDKAIAEVDPNGIGTDYLFDGLGRLIGTFPDGGQATLTSYGGPPSNRPEAAYLVSHMVSVPPATGGGCAPLLILNGRCFLETDQLVLDMEDKPIVSSRHYIDATWFDTLTQYDGRHRVVRHSKEVIRGTTTVPYDTYAYDGLNRPTSITHPDGSKETWTYPDAALPDAFVTNHFDEIGTKTATYRNQDGNTRLTEEVLTSTQRTGSRIIDTAFTYDAFDRVLSSTRWAGDGTNKKLTTTYGYDVRGRQTSITDPASGAKSLRYNPWNQVWHEQDAAGGRTSFPVFGDRVNWTRTDGDNRALAVRAWCSTGANCAHQFPMLGDNQNAIGKPVQLTALGPVASSSVGTTITEYSYDGLGRVYQKRVGTQFATGGTWIMPYYSITYGYDSEGRLSTVSYPPPANVAGAQPIVVQYQYAYATVVSVTMTSPSQATLWALNSATPTTTVFTSGDGTKNTKQFDPTTRRMISAEVDLPGGAIAQRYVYSYFDPADVTGPNGNVKTRVESVSGVSEQFRYDSLSRIERWTHTLGSATFNRVFSYDDFGTMTGTTTTGAVVASQAYLLASTNPYAVTDDGIFTYTYDAIGRQVTKVNKSTPSVNFGFRYLAGLAAPWSYDVNGASSEQYQYDANGRRAVKIAAATAGWTGTIYFEDDFEDRRSTSAPGHVYVAHVRAAGTLVADVQQSFSEGGAGATLSISYPHSDSIDSTTMVTGPTGNTTFYYEPFGQRVGTDGVTGLGLDPTQHLGFTGQEHDATGLINMKGRLYDPLLRRFLAPDPKSKIPFESQSYNRYAYVHNSPLLFTDPSGLTDYSPQGGATAWYTSPPPPDTTPVNMPSNAGAPSGGAAYGYGSSFDYGSYSAGGSDRTASPGSGMGDSGPTGIASSSSIGGSPGFDPTAGAEGRPSVEGGPVSGGYAAESTHTGFPGPFHDPFNLGIPAPASAAPDTFILAGVEGELGMPGVGFAGEAGYFFDGKTMQAFVGAGGYLGIPNVATIKAIKADYGENYELHIGVVSFGVLVENDGTYGGYVTGGGGAFAGGGFTANFATPWNDQEYSDPGAAARREEVDQTQQHW